MVTGLPPAAGSAADMESQYWYWKTKAEGLQDCLERETGGQSVLATLGKPVTQT